MFAFGYNLPSLKNLVHHEVGHRRGLPRRVIDREHAPTRCGGLSTTTTLSTIGSDTPSTGNIVVVVVVVSPPSSFVFHEVVPARGMGPRGGPTRGSGGYHLGTSLHEFGRLSERTETEAMVAAGRIGWSRCLDQSR